MLAHHWNHLTRSSRVGSRPDSLKHQPRRVLHQFRQPDGSGCGGRRASSGLPVRNGLPFGGFSNRNPAFSEEGAGWRWRGRFQNASFEMPASPPGCVRGRRSRRAPHRTGRSTTNTDDAWRETGPHLAAASPQYRLTPCATPVPPKPGLVVATSRSIGPRRRSRSVGHAGKSIRRIRRPHHFPGPLGIGQGHAWKTGDIGNGASFCEP